MKLKILDLFSGLGGFSLGLERTGHFRTIAFCDNDKYCNLVLQKHWKGVKIYNDVREISKEKFKEDKIEFPDIITGGFPCQPFSVAGKQKGTSDDRHLWPEMFRIIKAFKPRFVIGENVPGIVNIQDGVVFETLCTDLESQGYEVQPFNIPASAVGAPHQRKRIWIIATHSDYTGDRTPEHETNEDGQKTNEGWQEQSQLKSSGHSENASNSKSERLQRSRGQESDRNVNGFQQDKETIKSEIRGESERRSRTFRDEDVADTKNGRRQPSQSERWEGIKRGSIDSRGIEGERKNFSEERQRTMDQGWWSVEPNVGRVAHGVSGRVHRLRGLGNSIVPQIVEEIGYAIIKAAERK